LSLYFVSNPSTLDVRYGVSTAVTCVDTSQVCVAGAFLFDPAGAFILCNDFRLQESVEPVYGFLYPNTSLIYKTSNYIGSFVEITGTKRWSRVPWDHSIPICHRPPYPVVRTIFFAFLLVLTLPSYHSPCLPTLHHCRSLHCPAPLPRISLPSSGHLLLLSFELSELTS
jgi:hypothetical protein